MKNNSSKGYVANDINETNINQEEIKMGKNVQTNGEIILNKLEICDYILSNAKTGDYICFDNLEIVIPKFVFNGEKSEDERYYRLELDGSLNGEGKVIYNNENCIELVADKTIVVINRRKIKDGISNIKNGLNSNFELLENKVKSEYKFDFYSWNLGKAEKNIMKLGNSEEIGCSEENIYINMLLILCSKMDIDEMEKHFGKEYEDFKSYVKKYFMEDFLFLSNRIVCGLKNIEEEQDIFIKTLPACMVGIRTKSEYVQKSLINEIINDTKVGEFINTNLFSDNLEVYEIIEARKNNSNQSKNFVELRKTNHDSSNIFVIKNDSTDFLAISGTGEIYEGIKDSNGGIKNVIGYKNNFYAGVKDIDCRTLNILKVLKYSELSIDFYNFESMVFDFLDEIKDMTLEEMRTKKLIELNFLSDSKANIIEKDYEKMEVETSSIYSLYDIYMFWMNTGAYLNI